MASIFEGSDNKLVILNNNDNNINIFWTNQDIAKLNPDLLVQSLVISFIES